MKQVHLSEGCHIRDQYSHTKFNILQGEVSESIDQSIIALNIQHWHYSERDKTKKSV